MSRYETCLLGQVWAIKLPHELLMFHCHTLDHTHPSWKASSVASSPSGGNGVCHRAPLHSWQASVALLMVVQSFLDSSMWWWRSQKRRVWNLDSWVCSQKQLALNQLLMSFLNESASRKDVLSFVNFSKHLVFSPKYFYRMVAGRCSLLLCMKINKANTQTKSRILWLTSQLCHLDVMWPWKIKEAFQLPVYSSAKGGYNHQTFPVIVGTKWCTFCPFPGVVENIPW